MRPAVLIFPNSLSKQLSNRTKTQSRDWSKLTKWCVDEGVTHRPGSSRAVFFSLDSSRYDGKSTVKGTGYPQLLWTGCHAF
jgi:hypothetical protein